MAADLSSTSKSDCMISFLIPFHNTRCICRVLEAQSKDICAHIRLQHSTLLYDTHIVYINNRQRGEDPATDFVICAGEQLGQKGKFANQNTCRD